MCIGKEISRNLKIVIEEEYVKDATNVGDESRSAPGE